MNSNTKKLLAVATLLIMCFQSMAASVTISWDPPIPSNNVTGYKCYYGYGSRFDGIGYCTNIDNGGPVSNCTIVCPDLNPTKTYYFALTAYNLSSNESDYSAELVWDNTAPEIQVEYEKLFLTNSVMPNIITNSVITDNFSVYTNMNIWQTPLQGSLISNSVTMAFVYATDEAGNTASNGVELIWTPEPPTNLRLYEN